MQIENDVSTVADHIACSSETQAEMVLPVLGAAGELVEFSVEVADIV